MKRFGLAILLISAFGCTKVVVHGKDYPMEPVHQTFNHVLPHTYEAAKKALEETGYTILSADASKGAIKTNWLPTKATSHYVDLFDHRDYGTVGAYYQLQLTLAEQEGKSEVTIAAPVRSITHRIRSSETEERRVLKEIANLLRREDFELTNVGAED